MLYLKKSMLLSRRDPRADPCGTPRVIQVLSPMLTICLLSSKYDPHWVVHDNSFPIK